MTDASERTKVEGHGYGTGRRHDVWRLLRDSGDPLGTVQIAQRLEVHPNTVRFHLDALQRTGQVVQVAADRSRPGRPAQRFRAVGGMDPAGPRHYLLLARILTESLAASPDGPARAADAGRVWGTGLAHDAPAAAGRTPVERLIGLLADLGFAPETPGAGDDLVRLRHCPFLELARVRPGVVCPIHLGLMQGALAGWGAAVTVDRLRAFVEPDLCTGHLAGV
jgi:predicted ArsR family transcriptional regulator